MASIGYGYSRAEFINIATDFAVCRGRKVPTGLPFCNSWFEGFKRRHKQLTLAKPQKLSQLRAKCTSNKGLDNYFNELNDVLVKYNLTNKPKNLFLH